MDKEEIYLIGGGTLATFVLEIIERSETFKPCGIFDDTFTPGSFVSGVEVIGGLDLLESSQHLNFVCAVGNPKFREKVMTEHSEKRFPRIIDPTAVISKTAKISDGTIIGPLSTVLSHSSIGKGCCILANVNINQNVSVEDFVLIGASSTIGNEASIGKGAHIGLGQTIKLGESIDSWSNISA